MRTIESRILEEVNAYGGVTWHLDRGKARHKIGYYVSLYGFEKTVLNDVNEFTEKIIVDYIQENWSILDLKDHYLGIWIDGNYVYLDISIWIRDAVRALEFGRAQRQKAIWDCRRAIAINIS